MTCLTYRDGVMAWDDQDTIISQDPTGVGSMKWFGATKGVKLDDIGIIAAFSGDAYACAAMLDWLRSFRADDLNIMENESAEALVLHRDGRLESIDCFGRCIELDPKLYYAAGSGMAPAMAAMHCGKDAVEAIRVAHQIDPYTGAGVAFACW